MNITENMNENTPDVIDNKDEHSEEILKKIAVTLNRMHMGQ